MPGYLGVARSAMGRAWIGPDPAAERLADLILEGRDAIPEGFRPDVSL